MSGSFPWLDRRKSLLEGIRTVVLKVGSTVLASSEAGVDTRLQGAIAKQVSILRNKGIRVVIVSSGAIAAGRMKLGVGKRPLSLAMKQAAASIGQSRLMWGYEKAFSRYGIMVSQVLLTPNDVVDRQRFINLDRTLETLLSMDVVPIVNENDSVATEEIRFGDNDRLSALVSGTVRADFLLILSDVNGLFTSDPRLNPAASRIPHLESVTPDIRKLAGISRSGLGTGGMASKVLTAALANRWGLPVGIVLGRRSGILERFFEKGEGTLFDSNVSPWPSKKVWIGFFAEPRGVIRVDAGASTVLENRKSSLLAGGVLKVDGLFQEGDVVRIVDPEGRERARGRVRISSEVLGSWLDRRNRKATPEAWPIVVHKNEMTLWEESGES
ncbi:MAG: glutamate 5-kinase [Leptospirales bacterium]